MLPGQRLKSIFMSSADKEPHGAPGQPADDGAGRIYLPRFFQDRLAVFPAQFCDAAGRDCDFPGASGLLRLSICLYQIMLGKKLGLTIEPKRLTNTKEC